MVKEIFIFEILDLFNELEHYIFIVIQNNILYFSIIIAAIFGKLKESSKKNILAAWLIYFIGTFFHEITHLITSLITNGNPRWFSVLPSKNIDEQSGKISYTLGYVLNKNVRWYNVFIISMAPLLLFPLSFYIYENFFAYVEENLYSYIAYIFIIISLLFSSVPSGVDFSHVFKSKTLLLNLLPPIVIIIIVFNFEYIVQSFNTINLFIAKFIF